MTGSFLVGGIVAGSLLALSVPTAMKTADDESRAAFGPPSSLDDGSALIIPIEAAPEDLTPGAWAVPQGFYPPARRADAWVEPASLAQANLSYDDGEEALPPGLIEVNVIDDVTRPRDDEAAAMAEAARAAAADVQSVQSAPTEPAKTPEEHGPRSASSAS